MNLDSLFDIRDQKIVLSGAGGVLVGAMAEALAALGAQVALLDLMPEKAERVAGRITAAAGQALALACDVTDPLSIQRAFDTILAKWGQVDGLVNGAGGNHPRASTSKETPFFDLAPEAIRHTLDLNFLGTLFPCQIFGRQMAQQGRGGDHQHCHDEFHPAADTHPGLLGRQGSGC